MAKIRTYTTIEQAKILAKILPLESADMIYIMYRNGEKPQNGDANLSTVYESSEHNWYWVDIIDESWNMRIGEDVPCWSLAALLDQLPYELCDDDGNLAYLQMNKEDNVYQLIYENPYGDFERIETDVYEYFVDTCYEMILKLNELNLL